MKDEEIREVLRRPQGRPRSGSWRCPDELTLAAYSEGSLDAARRDRLEAHLDRCAFCYDQVAFLLRAADAPLPESVPASLLARAEELVPERVTLGWSPAWRWVAATAAVAALTVAVTLRLQQPETTAPVLPPPAPAIQAPTPQIPPPVTPQGSAPAAKSPAVERRTPAPRGEFAVEFPADGATLTRSELQFRWKALEAALFYEVQILTEEGGLVWEGRATENHLRLPANARLAAGERYYVWVRVQLADGAQVRSRAVSFRIAP
jgi:hypothetical protein